jgi:hypothetical protein
MSKTDEKNIRITLSKHTHTELTILSMRKDIDVKDLISDLLDKQVSKIKEPSNM